MPDIVPYLAFVWMTVLLAASGGRYTVTHGRREHPRLDTLTLILLALLVLYGGSIRSPFFLDATLTLALLAFLGTLAAARYHGEKKIS